MEMQQQAQPAPNEDADVDAVAKMQAGLIDHIFGEGEAGIVKRMKDGGAEMDKTIGTLALTMVQEGGKQAEEAGVPFDFDMLAGVATEVIDSLLQLAEANGLIESADDQTLRDDAMGAAIEAYAMTSDASPEDQEAAQQMLQQFSDAGMVDEAAGTFAEMGKRRGVDPFAEDAPVDSAPAGQQPAPQGQAPLIGG